VATKGLAERFLLPEQTQHDLFGDALRLTLVYNPGAAFGLHVGPYSRWIFMALTIAALFILWRIYGTARADERARVLAAALVSGGAIGNVIDRIRSARGVVDFIDVGIGDNRWPTFNIADIAVSTGAILLAVVLWVEKEEPATSVASVTTPADGTSAS
jgi:signal peptidase II